jgi:hypothetical protein
LGSSRNRDTRSGVGARISFKSNLFQRNSAASSRIAGHIWRAGSQVDDGRSFIPKRLWHTHAQPTADIVLRCHIAQELVVHVLGLPLSSVIVLIVIPLGIIAYQYYLCWQIKTGRRE